MPERLILSQTEKNQLGNPKNNSSFNYVSRSDWQVLRQNLLQESFYAQPGLTKDMVAFSPGETLVLLENPKVRKWHKEVVKFEIPKKYKIVILVPCAKTKPWDSSHSKRSILYSAYNQIISISEEGKIPPVYFATISEPLGIVPQDLWADFPPYDNPGLFKDDFLRTGLKRTELGELFGERKALPFDDNAYQKSIEAIGRVVASFLYKNSGKRFLSFVDGQPGTQSTHAEMLDFALAKLKQKGVSIDLQRFTKRSGKLQSPLGHILSKIQDSL